MKKYLILSSLFLTFGLFAQSSEQKEINQLLDAWHQAAANADFDAYFDSMTADGVFVGTDATEHWGREEFMAFSKPYFDRGKAWDFTPLERHVFISPDGGVAWFDELLDTWMQLCRGSGVVVLEDGQWRIAHYVLSIAVPNEEVSGVIELKKEKDSILRSSLLLRQPN
jgi:ketosteroid isomerase-like protein